MRSRQWEEQRSKATGTASIGSSRELGKVDDTRYHNRPSHHSAGTCDPYSQAGTSGTALAVSPYGFDRACHCNPGGGTLHPIQGTVSNTTGLQSRAVSASRLAPAPRYRLPDLGLGNALAHVHQHCLHIWTVLLLGAVYPLFQGPQHLHGKEHRQGGLQAQWVDAPAKAHREKPFGMIGTAVRSRGFGVPV